MTAAAGQRSMARSGRPTAWQAPSKRSAVLGRKPSDHFSRTWTELGARQLARSGHQGVADGPTGVSRGPGWT
eukprot:4155075-Alexandrium_andersonii.AAC.1